MTIREQARFMHAFKDPASVTQIARMRRGRTERADHDLARDAMNPFDVISELANNPEFHPQSLNLGDPDYDFDLAFVWAPTTSQYKSAFTKVLGQYTVLHNSYDVSGSGGELQKSFKDWLEYRRDVMKRPIKNFKQIVYLHYCFQDHQDIKALLSRALPSGERASTFLNGRLLDGDGDFDDGSAATARAEAAAAASRASAKRPARRGPSSGGTKKRRVEHEQIDLVSDDESEGSARMLEAKTLATAAAQDQTAKLIALSDSVTSCDILGPAERLAIKNQFRFSMGMTLMTETQWVQYQTTAGVPVTVGANA